ncbi:hypothetical protein Patl1_33680 [Pistacia atlantica]|uniref:Uncharacterized protein n=1 Tax=Pistacia atlantica TaxID=434234 RepID=A0ACC0ZUI9_9ROSI|nr:hypothetical protein Patl1_33680 [Pistacia atlantica]
MPVPNLEESYSEVRREAVRQTTLKGESGNIETSAMVAQNRSQHVKSSKSYNKDKKCTHCNKSGHTKNQCFELVGYPNWWDHNRDQRKKNSKKNSIAAIVEKKEDVDHCSSFVATTGNDGKSLHMCTSVSNSAWIIDSGATDHMTFDSMHISHLKPSSHKFVSTANGESTQVIGEGSVTFQNTLNLDSVLVVPSLNYNFLSITQITKTLSCVVIFWPDFCVFKSIQTKQMIGCGIRRGQMYYLDLEKKILP